MVTTPKYLLVQERVGVSLSEKLIHWRECGVSYNSIARMLKAETGVDLTGQTINDWVRVIQSAA